MCECVDVRMCELKMQSLIYKLRNGQDLFIYISGKGTKNEYRGNMDAGM